MQDLVCSFAFQKIVIVKEDIMPYRDNHGIYFTGLFQFLNSEKLFRYL